MWGQLADPDPDYAAPSEWGWSFCDGEGWKAIWITIPQALKALEVLLKCGCKKPCIPTRCKCLKSGLVCTALCFCDGKCEGSLLLMQEKKA